MGPEHNFSGRVGEMVGRSANLAAEAIRGSKGVFLRGMAGVGLLAAGFLPTGPVLADGDGAEVLRAFPVGLSDIDNPCTPELEAVDYTGFLHQVKTPSGNEEFHTILKASNGDVLTEVFTTKLSSDESTLVTGFKELLITRGPSGNAEFNGTITTNISDGTSTIVFTSSCLGPKQN